MKRSAHNPLRGTIKDVHKGHAHVRIAVGGGAMVTAPINEAVE